MSEATLDGPKLKLDRAKKHLDDLEAAINGFFETNPYAVRVKDNPETGKREHIVVKADDLPASLSVLSGDAVHNLRSALDHIIWQLVIANGGEPEDLRTAFPVWRSEADFEAGRPGDAKGISEAALDVLYGLKPYKGGNDALWLLHKLDIVDKHRLLLSVASAYQQFVIDLGPSVSKMTGQADVPKIPLSLLPEERYSLAVDVSLFASPLGDETHDDLEFTIEVALDEPEVATGEPLVPALRQLAGFVDEVFDLFAPLVSGP